MSNSDRVIQHAENVWSYRHNWERVEPAIGMILTDEGWVAVDGGSSPVHGYEVLAEMQSIAKKPVKYVVATHRHFDHTFGNQAYDAPVLSGAKCKERFDINVLDDWSKENALDWLKRDMFPNIPALSENDFVGYEPVSPATTFEDDLSLSVGNVQLEFFHLPGVHTDDGIVVYLPSEKVIFLSDAFYFLPGPEGSFLELPHLINKVDQLEVAHYVPGHERPHDREIFEKLQSYVNELIDDVKSRIAEGASRADVLSIAIKPRYLETKTSFIGERLHKRHLIGTYRELTAKS